MKLPLPQYSSSMSCSLLPRVTFFAHVSIFSHMPPFGWLKAPSTCEKRRVNYKECSVEAEDVQTLVLLLKGIWVTSET